MKIITNGKKPEFVQQVTCKTQFNLGSKPGCGSVLEVGIADCFVKVEKNYDQRDGEYNVDRVYVTCPVCLKQIRIDVPSWVITEVKATQGSRSGQWGR